MHNTARPEIHSHVTPLPPSPISPPAGRGAYTHRGGVRCCSRLTTDCWNSSSARCRRRSRSSCEGVAYQTPPYPASKKVGAIPGEGAKRRPGPRSSACRCRFCSSSGWAVGAALGGGGGGAGSAVVAVRCGGGEASSPPNPPP